MQLHLHLDDHPDPGHHAVLHGPRGQDHGAVLPLRDRGGDLHGLVHSGVHHQSHLLPQQNIIRQKIHELD